MEKTLSQTKMKENLNKFWSPERIQEGTGVFSSWNENSTSLSPSTGRRTPPRKEVLRGVQQSTKEQKISKGESNVLMSANFDYKFDRTDKHLRHM